jgi:hypothetical protein
MCKIDVGVLTNKAFDKFVIILSRSKPINSILKDFKLKIRLLFEKNKKIKILSIMSAS